MKILGKMGCFLLVEAKLISMGFAAAVPGVGEPQNLATKGKPGLVLKVKGQPPAQVSKVFLGTPKVPQTPSHQKPITLEVEVIDEIMSSLVERCPEQQKERLSGLCEQGVSIRFVNTTNNQCIVYDPEGSFTFYDDADAADSREAKTVYLEHELFEFLGNEIRKRSQEEEEGEALAGEEPKEKLKENDRLKIRKYEIDKKYEHETAKTWTATLKECFLAMLNFVGVVMVKQNQKMIQQNQDRGDLWGAVAAGAIGTMQDKFISDSPEAMGQSGDKLRLARPMKTQQPARRKVARSQAPGRMIHPVAR